MKNLKNRLVLEKKSKVTVTLAQIIFTYFNGTDQDALEASDGLFSLNNYDESYKLFKTYEDWFNYFYKNRGEKVEVTIDALTEKDSSYKSSMSFRLPNKRGGSLYWECIGEANDLIEVLTFFSTKFNVNL